MAQALTKAAAVVWRVPHAAPVQPLRSAAALLPRLAARQRPLTTAAAAAADPADPYWADADKPKVNVYSAYTIYKVCTGDAAAGRCASAAILARAWLCRRAKALGLVVGRTRRLLSPRLPQGSAAMSLKVIKPTWQQIGSGLAIEREGTVLLEFAKSTGPKSYAWEQKEVGLGGCASVRGGIKGAVTCEQCLA